MISSLPLLMGSTVTVQPTDRYQMEAALLGLSRRFHCSPLIVGPSRGVELGQRDEMGENVYY